MYTSKSKTFNAIRDIVIAKELNEDGFRVSDISKSAANVNVGTLRTFIPKHTTTKIVYFERICRGLYRIKREYL